MTKKLCASCNTDRQVKFYGKGQTQWGFFKIGWDLCVHCYDREVNMEHDRQERLHNKIEFEVMEHGLVKIKTESRGD